MPPNQGKDETGGQNQQNQVGVVPLFQGSRLGWFGEGGPLKIIPIQAGTCCQQLKSVPNESKVLANESSKLNLALKLTKRNH